MRSSLYELIYPKERTRALQHASPEGLWEKNLESDAVRRWPVKWFAGENEEYNIVRLIVKLASNVGQDEAKDRESLTIETGEHERGLCR